MSNEVLLRANNLRQVELLPVPNWWCYKLQLKFRVAFSAGKSNEYSNSEEQRNINHTFHASDSNWNHWIRFSEKKSISTLKLCLRLRRSAFNVKVMRAFVQACCARSPLRRWWRACAAPSAAPSSPARRPTASTRTPSTYALSTLAR